MQHCLIHRHYKFELCHNAVEAIKNISCTKVEGTVDHIIVTRWFKKSYLGCKNLDQATMDFEAKSSK